MKGILKLSTLALSAAMVAGLSTPVFAAGASTQDTSTKIYVEDTNGDLVGTTDNSKTTYTFQGKKTGDVGVTDQDGSKNYLNAVIVKGGTVTLHGSEGVKWALDADQKKTNNGSVEDARKKVSYTTDGTDITITVAKDATTDANVAFVAYLDSSYESGSSTKLSSGKYVIVHVIPKDVSKVTLEYDEGDSKYVEDDMATDASGNATGNTLKELEAGSTLTEVNNSTTALKKYASKKVNHLEVGETAAFSAKYYWTDTNGTYEDDSDYNSTATAYVETADSGKWASVNGYAVANVNSTSKNGTVTVTGASSKGYGRFYVRVDDNKNAPCNYLYVVTEAVDTEQVYRLYNAKTGEHFYTTSKKEVLADVKLGWTFEGYAWKAPTSGDPVYRVYNANGDEHLFTTDENEKNALVAAGWTDEGTAFYSASSVYTPVYREYNPNKFAHNHNYTTNSSENMNLIQLGWQGEGVAFYATSYDEATPEKKLEAWAVVNQINQ